MNHKIIIKATFEEVVEALKKTTTKGWGDYYFENESEAWPYAADLWRINHYIISNGNFEKEHRSGHIEYSRWMNSKNPRHSIYQRYYNCELICKPEDISKIDYLQEFEIVEIYE